jgi:UDP-N-acetylglucosamine 2-epimerase (non-hydrolysing)
MKKKRILIVFGTRPEAIKMAPLVKEFQKHSEYFETKVCVTAQHRELLDQVLHLFEIIPDYDLNIMKSGQDLYDITTRVLMGMKTVLNEAKPDLVLVHGDTTTSTSAALASFYQQIPVGHIEAGLRTHNIYSPWPEEMNRQITGRIASYHFSPTNLSKTNLLNEGIQNDKIFVTGNSVIDALYWVLDKIKKTPNIQSQIVQQLMSVEIAEDLLESWIDHNRKMVLITGHRRENFGQGFINICESIKELAKLFPNVDFVYPMHLNPNVRNAIKTVFNESEEISNAIFTEPLDYLPFVYLMSNSYLILTDSGGIQEEAPSIGKPVLVMRDTTERPEALDAGTIKLVGTQKNLIIQEVSELINNPKAYNEMSKALNPYGSGDTCSEIIKLIRNF